MRSEEEVKELIKIFQEEYETMDKDPAKLVRATGGNVPPIVSSVQILLTKDMATFGINILKWCNGEENGVLTISKLMNEKLKYA